jgi:AraC family transcriptional regulator
MIESRINVSLMDSFPDFSAPGFDIDSYNTQFQKATVIIDALSNNVGFPEHWGGLSIKCAFNGYEYYESDGEFYAVNDSSYLIFNEGKYYSSFIDSKNEVNSFTINFTSEMEQWVVHSLKHSASQLIDNPDIVTKSEFRFLEKVSSYNSAIQSRINVLRNLSKDWKENQEEIRENLFALLEQMVFCETDRLSGNSLKAVKAVTKRELLKRMNAARDYIISNYSRNITLESIADVACMNEYYFLRQFKRMFDITPHHYLQQLRIIEATKLLRQSNDSIKEICPKVGFQDPASFGKLFRRTYDQTPGEFREMYFQNKNRNY